MGLSLVAKQELRDCALGGEFGSDFDAPLASPCADYHLPKRHVCFLPSSFGFLVHWRCLQGLRVKAMFWAFLV